VKSQGTGKLLAVFVGESSRWHGQPLYTAIVDALRRAGLRGATVFRGIEGHGGHQVVHAARVFDLASGLSILDATLEEGLVTLESVELIRYGPGTPGTSASP
jgi:PII-like signaling protein